MINLTGPVTGVIERSGVSQKTGKPWAIRKAVILNGMGTVQVMLTKDVPTPGDGEVVNYEVGVSARVDDKGGVYVDYTAFRALALPDLASPSPSRAAS